MVVSGQELNELESNVRVERRLGIFQLDGPIVQMDRLRFPQWKAVAPIHKENKGLESQLGTLSSPISDFAPK